MSENDDKKLFAIKQKCILTKEPFNFPVRIAREIVKESGPGYAVPAAAWAIERFLQYVYRFDLKTLDDMITLKLMLREIFAGLQNIQPKRRILHMLEILFGQNESAELIKKEFCDFQSYYQDRWPTSLHGLLRWLKGAKTAIAYLRGDTYAERFAEKQK